MDTRTEITLDANDGCGMVQILSHALGDPSSTSEDQRSRVLEAFRMEMLSFAKQAFNKGIEFQKTQGN